jgi:HEAT repeat protein
VKGSDPKCRSHVPSKFLASLLALGLFTLSISVRDASQDQGKQKSDEEKAKELLKDPQYALNDVLNHKPEAVARMVELFRLTNDSNLKQRAASILVRSGIEDPVYFDYLTREAQKSLDNDMPWPVLYDEDGNKKSNTINTLNPEFLKWCKQHNRDPGETFYAAYYEIPVPWYHLGAAGDPRAYHLLIQGLHSQNPMIATWAAHGLALLRDSRSIDEIIAVARRAPLECRYSIAEALLYFPDEKARVGVDEIFVDKKVLAGIRAQVREKGIKWLYNF